MASPRATRPPAHKKLLAWPMAAALVMAVSAVVAAAGSVTDGDAGDTEAASDGSREPPPALTLASADAVPQRDAHERRSRTRSSRAARGRTAGALPKSVTLIVRGTATRVKTRADTVSGVLATARLDLSEHDRVEPGPDERLSGSMRVVVEKVDVETEVQVETIPHETVRKETSSRQRGEEVLVQEGRDGQRETTIERVFVDGVEESATVVAEEVTDPVDDIVEVGTAPPPEPKTSSSGGGGDGVWDRLAGCESNHNWSLVHSAGGHTFYGGLQFMKGTWDSVGGTEFAAYPHQATREQQIIAGKRLQRRSGWGQWPACSKILGLR